MKYYIIAGEASGDLHGSNLIKELRRVDAAATIRCWGGDKMQQAGGELVKHYRDLAFMGFWEVLKNIFTILRNLTFCKKDIEQFHPDTLVLIDYPGFNLRIAKWAKQKGVRIIYYISPQVWAWKENRVKMMKQTIDKMIVILPFEKDYFRNKWNWEVDYVGHPLVEVIESHKSGVQSSESGVNSRESGINSRESVVGSHESINHTLNSELRTPNSKLIALLPGSRKQEILKKLPVMLEVSKAFPSDQFIVAKAPGIDDIFYSSLLSSYNNVSAVSGKTYDLLMQSKAALVTSGTATLETALFGVPEVVCYKGSFLSYQIGKRLVKVKYISLVNLIMDKLVVKELIQQEMNVNNLEHELHELLTNEQRISQLKKDYSGLKDILSQQGNASAKAAQLIYDFTSAK
jgi:lipid-A-disaccharide synthase